MIRTPFMFNIYLEIPNASKFLCRSGKTRFFQMAPNIFGLRSVLRTHTFSSFGSFRDVKPSLACFLKLCSCAMFACGCAVLACDQTHFLHSTSCYLFMFFSGRMEFRMVAPCFSDWFDPSCTQMTNDSRITWVCYNRIVFRLGINDHKAGKWKIDINRP